MNNELVSSTLTGRQFKMTIYEYVSTIKPMVTYAVETWTLTERAMNYLMVFERRIIRKSFGPIQKRDGWRIRINHELDTLIGGSSTLKFIKTQRLKW